MSDFHKCNKGNKRKEVATRHANFCAVGNLGKTRMFKIRSLSSFTTRDLANRVLPVKELLNFVTSRYKYSMLAFAGQSQK